MKSPASYNRMLLRPRMWPEHNAYKKNIDGGSGGFNTPVECCTDRVKSGLSSTRKKCEGHAFALSSTKHIRTVQEHKQTAPAECFRCSSMSIYRFEWSISFFVDFPSVNFFYLNDLQPSLKVKNKAFDRFIMFV